MAASLTSGKVQCVILTLLVMAGYFVTLSSFFVADDLWQIHYAYKIFDGEPDLIWRFFTGNYIEIPGFGFYRPLLGLSFFLDYLIWRANPVGYHLTNIILYALNVVLLYWILRLLTSKWSIARSSLFAFFSTAMFAVNPLHCEAVAWLSGRADVLAGVFYLTSLLLFVKTIGSPRLSWTVASSGCFMLALFSKEIACGLPLLAFATYVFIRRRDRPGADTREPEPTTADHFEAEEEPPRPAAASGDEPVAEEQSARLVEADLVIESSIESSIDRTEGATEAADAALLTGRFQHLLDALRATASLWVVLILYLGLRKLLLGTIFGGYSGTFGAAKAQYAIQNWLDPLIWARVALPLNSFVVSPMLVLALALALSLILLWLIAILRGPVSFPGGSPVNLLLLWIVTTLVPLYGVWGIDPVLHNSRILFFFTMPMSALLPALLFQSEKTTGRRLRDWMSRLAPYAGSALFSIIIVCFSCAMAQTNHNWTKAGRTVREFLSQCKQATGEGSTASGRIAVIGFPDDYDGAFVILNGSTMHHLLSPPFASSILYDRVITFKPAIVGPGSAINTSRLKRVLADEKLRGVYTWDVRGFQLKPLRLRSLTGARQELNLPVKGEVGKGDGSIEQSGWWASADYNPVRTESGSLRLSSRRRVIESYTSKLDLSPTDWDFIQFDLAVAANRTRFASLIPISVTWNDGYRNASIGAIQHPVSRTRQVVRIGLSQYWRWFAEERISSLGIKLRINKDVEISNIKLLSAEGIVPSVSLSGRSERSSGEYVISEGDVNVAWDATKIPGAAGVVVEVSKPNFFFDSSTRPKGGSEITRLKIDGASGEQRLEPGLFRPGAFTQIRVRCLNARMVPEGEYSDPVTLFKLGEGKNSYLE